MTTMNTTVRRSRIVSSSSLRKTVMIVFTQCPPLLRPVSARAIPSRAPGTSDLVNLHRAHEARLRVDHRGRPRGLAFTQSTDSGQTFAAPIVVPGSADPALGDNGSPQGLLMKRLAVNEAGAIAVVNSTFSRGKTSHIWLLRGQSAGR